MERSLTIQVNEGYPILVSKSALKLDAMSYVILRPSIASGFEANIMFGHVTHNGQCWVVEAPDIRRQYEMLEDAHDSMIYLATIRSQRARKSDANRNRRAFEIDQFLFAYKVAQEG